MLRALSVLNFAVIESLSLDFDCGFTAFTGETGAGKSILIEALGFLMGGRGSTDWIRTGADKLEVSGVFEAARMKSAVRKRFELGEAFELRRELDNSGRTRAYLNGRTVKLADLSELGRGLVDFHGQHEHQNLFRPESQLEYLDGYGRHEKYLSEVAQAYARHSDLRARQEALAISEEERLRRIDMLSFQISEIDEVSPKEGEDDRLRELLPRIKNAEKLRTLAANAYAELYEKDGSAEEALRNAEECLEKMAAFDPSLSDVLADLSRARETASEAAARVASYRDDSELGSAELDELIGRQDKLARLSKKYGGTIRDVLEFRTTAHSERADLENHKVSARNIERDLILSEKSMIAASEKLHKARTAAGKKLAARVEAELKDLGMPSVRFSIAVELEEGFFSAQGSDRIEYLIAPNPGEPARALRQIASGGELSRVMLGLKKVLAEQDRIGLMIFDEVDTGVGAAVGSSVGAKLSEIAAAHQVFCVTHLPQVACRAKAHYEVIKRVASGRTFTDVRRLEAGERIEAVARMLGGRKATAASRRHAKELMTPL